MARNSVINATDETLACSEINQALSERHRQKGIWDMSNRGIYFEKKLQFTNNCYFNPVTVIFFCFCLVLNKYQRLIMILKFL